MRINALALLLIFIFPACSTLHKQAKNHLENESYAEAISIYDKILETDSTDEDALTGLNLAREGWLNQKLVEVRFLRMSGSNQKSLDLLHELYQKESSWRHFLTGPSALYQKKEINFAQNYISTLVSLALKNQKPLKAQFVLDKYYVFYESKDSQDKFSFLQSSVKNLGMKQCKEFSASLTTEQFYYGLFVRKLCSVWNLKKPNLAMQKKKIRTKLYSSIVFEPNSSKLPKHYHQKLKEGLLKKLKQSPWYSKTGNNILKLSLMGKYKYSHSRRRRKLKHSYTVSIPYTVERIEKKPESNEKSNLDHTMELVSATSDVITSLTGGSVESSYPKDNGDGTITVVETKYREEPRETTYRATEHTEVFDLTLDFTGVFNGDQFKLVHSAGDWKSSIGHKNNMPGIGLKPQKPSLIGKDNWFDRQEKLVAGNFQAKLNEAWDDLYCDEEFAGQSKTDQVESMFRCLKIRKKNRPSEIKNWFELTMGLTLDQANNWSKL